MFNTQSNSSRGTCVFVFKPQTSGVMSHCHTQRPTQKIMIREASKCGYIFKCLVKTLHAVVLMFKWLCVRQLKQTKEGMGREHHCRPENQIFSMNMKSQCHLRGMEYRGVGYVMDIYGRGVRYRTL